jgi:bifunctional UDP-N-acetylglucosamine pyrophosphorylase/glucosamine-1-phosphate N-acetyltransferase
MQAEPLLAADADLVLVYAADMPLPKVETLRNVVAMHGRHHGPLTMLSVVAEDPRGFGRVVRDANGEVLGIVEEVEATAEQRSIRELNVGVYCFEAKWLWSALKRLEPSPQKGEYYLTDTVGLAMADGFRVSVVTTEDLDEVMGINTRVHLSEAERILRQRKNGELMLSGVTIIDPHATYVHSDVFVGRDTVLEPGVCLFGSTQVGDECHIEAGAVLTDVQLGDGCRVGAGAVLNAVVVPPDAVFSPGVVVQNAGAR